MIFDELPTSPRRSSGISSDGSDDVRRAPVPARDMQSGPRQLRFPAHPLVDRRRLPDPRAERRGALVRARVDGGDLVVRRRGGGRTGPSRWRSAYSFRSSAKTADNPHPPRGGSRKYIGAPEALPQVERMRLLGDEGNGGNWRFRAREGREVFARRLQAHGRAARRIVGEVRFRTRRRRTDREAPDRTGRGGRAGRAVRGRPALDRRSESMRLRGPTSSSRYVASPNSTAGS